MRTRWILFYPDEGSGGESGEGGGSTEGSGEPAGSQEAPGGQETSTDTVPRSELAKANAEAAKFRKQLREAQGKVEEYEANAKTESEKATERAIKAEERAVKAEERNRELRGRLIAAEVGVVREAQVDAARLLDWSSVEDPDDDGQVRAAMQTLVKDKPYLLGTSNGADGGAGATTGGSESVDMNAMLRKASGR